MKNKLLLKICALIKSIKSSSLFDRNLKGNDRGLSSAPSQPQNMESEDDPVLLLLKTVVERSNATRDVITKSLEVTYSWPLLNDEGQSFRCLSQCVHDFPGLLNIMHAADRAKDLFKGHDLRHWQWGISRERG